MSLRVDPSAVKSVSFSVAVSPPENDTCGRTLKVVLPIIASLAGFFFLPIEAAFLLTGSVTIITLLCCGCIDAETVGKISKLPPFHIPVPHKSGGPSTHRPGPQAPEHEEVNRPAPSQSARVSGTHKTHRKPKRSKEHESVNVSAQLPRPLNHAPHASRNLNAPEHEEIEL